MNKNTQYNLKSSQNVKILFFLILSFLFCQSLVSQFYWQKTYKSTIGGDEEAYAICETEQNNYFILGYAGTISYNIFLIKINQFGDTLYNKIVNQGIAYSVAKTNDYGCIYAGARGSVAIAGRLNANGDTIWNKSFNAINFMDIKQTPDNNYIMCGVEYSNNKYNGYICKIDITGNIIWDSIYPAENSKDFLTIVSDINGGYIIGGVTQDFTGGFQNAYLCKINDIGLVEWEKRYYLSNSCYCSSIIQTGTGYIIAGRNSNNVYLLKLNNNGDTVKLNNINNTNNISTSPKIIQYSQNRYFLAHVNNLQSKIHSFDEYLNIYNQLTLQANSPHAIYIYSMIKASNSQNGDIIFVGSTDYLEFANLDFYAIRLDSSLTPPPPIGVINIAEEIIDSYYLSNCYPNPFNPSTKLNFVLKKNGFVKLKIFDSVGKLLKVIVSGYYMTGSYVYDFNASNLASGIYFYRYEVNDKIIDTKKMCLIK